MNNEHKITLQPIKKHYYPLWIKCFLSIISILAISLLAEFFICEYDVHFSLKKEIEKAEKVFQAKNYQESFELYRKLYNEYPSFKQAKVRFAESCFALSQNDEVYYWVGVKLLEENQYTQATINEILCFIPEKHHEHFNSLVN